MQKVIIGPHGAAFNIIFSKQGLKLVELIPSDHLSKNVKKFQTYLILITKRLN